VSGPQSFSEDERRFIDLVAEQLDENKRKALLRDLAGATVTPTGDFLNVHLRD
jgi:hypothetical protein